MYNHTQIGQIIIAVGLELDWKSNPACTNTIINLGMNEE
jgi:hypothetical protein